MTMTTKREYPKLVSVNQKGLAKFWCIRVISDGSGVFTQTEAWSIKANGEESKHVVSAPSRVEAKNVGRANETSPIEQACLEAESALRAKQDKGYWVDGEEAPVQRPLPMLALPYEQRKHDLVYPCAIQPKVDGARALFNGSIAWSRLGKEFPAESLRHLGFSDPGVVVDGELMLPQADYTFQDTMSAIKRPQDLSQLLEYHVYDLVDTEATFTERYARLRQLHEEAGWPEGVKLVETRLVGSEHEFMRAHDEYVGQGYEGIMLRNVDGLYKLKHRSPDLLKYKSFDDREWPVVRVEEGSGKFQGSAILVCQTEDGKEFKATPKGSQDYRRQLWLDREEVVGQLWTIRYQGLSSDGIPRFPIGITARNYE